jgi:hypothetical protein
MADLLFLPHFLRSRVKSGVVPFVDFSNHPPGEVPRLL